MQQQKNQLKESMAHSYSHLFNLPVTMFRFFTVYGPWGRPDMALFKFTKAILKANQPIDVYNHGNMVRDFTYIDDLVCSIELLAKNIPCQIMSWIEISFHMIACHQLHLFEL